jgi:hypothetical protein
MVSESTSQGSPLVLMRWKHLWSPYYEECIDISKAERAVLVVLQFLVHDA